MELCQSKRGEYVDIDYIDETRRNIIYNIPLSEIVYDFFDKLKSSTKGYASFDYELIGYRESKLQKNGYFINGDVVDALSSIVHKDFAYSRGKVICEKLKEIILTNSFPRARSFPTFPLNRCLPMWSSTRIFSPPLKKRPPSRLHLSRSQTAQMGISV